MTGCDIAPNWLAQARRNAAAEGLTVLFEEDDAKALPYKNAAFDAVVSLIGAMFAPRPELVAAELTRVCRPGGIIAMGNWTGSGFVGQMFQTIARHIAPSGMPSPVFWADDARVFIDRRRGPTGTSPRTDRSLVPPQPGHRRNHRVDAEYLQVVAVREQSKEGNHAVN